MKRSKFWINLGVGLAVAVFFLWLFFRSVEDWGEIWEALRTAKYGYVLLAAVLALVQYIFRTYRWYYLLHDIKKISFFGLFSPMMIGFMANCLLPARAGEFIRAYLLSEKENVKLSASLASIVVDRMFDTFVLLLLMAGVLLFYPLDEEVLTRTTSYSLTHVKLFLGVFVTSVFAVVLGLTILVYHQKELAAKILNRALFFLPRRFREKIIGIFMGLTEGLHIFRNWRHIFISIILTIIQWIFGVLMFYPLILAFDLQDKLSLASTATILSSAAVGVSIPTPGYVGSYHFFVQTGIQLCDATISDSVAKVFAIIAHAATFFPVIILGIILAFNEGVSLFQIQADSEKIKESAE